MADGRWSAVEDCCLGVEMDQLDDIMRALGLNGSGCAWMDAGVTEWSSGGWRRKANVDAVKPQTGDPFSVRRKTLSQDVGLKGDNTKNIAGEAIM